MGRNSHEKSKPKEYSGAKAAHDKEAEHTEEEGVRQKVVKVTVDENPKGEAPPLMMRNNQVMINLKVFRIDIPKVPADEIAKQWPDQRRFQPIPIVDVIEVIGMRFFSNFHSLTNMGVLLLKSSSTLVLSPNLAL